MAYQHNPMKRKHHGEERSNVTNYSTITQSKRRVLSPVISDYEFNNYEMERINASMAKYNFREGACDLENFTSKFRGSKYEQKCHSLFFKSPIKLKELPIDQLSPKSAGVNMRMMGYPVSNDELLSRFFPQPTFPPSSNIIPSISKPNENIDQKNYKRKRIEF